MPAARLRLPVAGRVAQVRRHLGLQAAFQGDPRELAQQAAVAGELWAKQKVIEHYTPMIDELAVDEDMKQHLILKLLEELPNFPMGQA